MTYLRSSSYGAHEFCPHRYFLEYNVGLKGDANVQADKGNIVHKVMEALAHSKLCQQNKTTSFIDDLLGEVNVQDCDPCKLLETIFEHNKDHDWTLKDRADCKEWTERILNYGNGEYDPRNREVVAPEGKFDILVKKPWAKYNFALPDGTNLKGFLALKGTIDLMVKTKLDGVYELIDYKTGGRVDWNKTVIKVKTLEDLHNDYQLLLYYYAACHLYPEVDDITITIFFARDTVNNKVVYPGGPFQINFSKEDFPRIEGMIRRKFDQIVATKIPKLHKTWKCKSFCYFGKTLSSEDPSKTICEHFEDKIRKVGINQVLKEDAQLDEISRYGSGGGRK